MPPKNAYNNQYHTLHHKKWAFLSHSTNETRNIGHALMPWYHRFAGRDHSHPLLTSFQSVSAGVLLFYRRDCE